MNLFLKYLTLYALTLPVFFVVDMIWLGVIARKFYRQQLGYLLAPKVNWTAAIIFYLIFIAGIIFFAVVPGMKRESLLHTVMLGAIFGFITYATYDLTNLATIKDWPLMVTVVDMCWGAVLSATVASASFLIGRKLLGF